MLGLLLVQSLAVVFNSVHRHLQAILSDGCHRVINRLLTCYQLLGQAGITWCFQRATPEVISEPSRSDDLVQKRVTGLESCTNANSTCWREDACLKVECELSQVPSSNKTSSYHTSEINPSSEISCKEQPWSQERETDLEFFPTFFFLSTQSQW